METIEAHLLQKLMTSETQAERPQAQNPKAESRKTAMANKPFWTLRVHDKRDVLLARQKARQIAHLLHFPPLEEACIAAGAFAIAAQAREHYEICDVCFQLDHHQLIVFAKPLGEEPSIAPTAKMETQTAVASKATAPMMKLAKGLPDAARGFSVDELSFLIARINDQAPADLFGELSKQNQEILLLLHLVNHPGDQLGQKSTSAA